MFDQTNHREPPGGEPDPVPPEFPGDRARDRGGPSALVLFLVAAGLVVGGYFLAVKLKEMIRLQDCVMSGRTNCAPISAPPSR